jgi:hypothetical protein
MEVNTRGTTADDHAISGGGVGIGRMPFLEVFNESEKVS